MPRNRLKIGVLSFHNSKETKDILNKIEKIGHEPVWIRKSNLNLYMTENGLDMSPEVDVIINRLLLSTSNQPIEYLGVLDAVENIVPVLNPSSSVITSLNKIASVARISDSEDIKSPNSLFGSSNEMGEFLEERGEAVYKKAVGTHGKGTFLINDMDSAISDVNGSYSIIQEKIEQSGEATDVRAYVVGGRIVASMRRKAADDNWRANIAQGGSAEEVVLSDDIRRSVVKATNEHNLDYAGVDLIKRKDGSWRFLEVNPTAGFKGLFNATNTSPAPYIIGEAIKKVGSVVDYEDLERYTSELDDSLPSCKPPYGFDEKPIIGLEVMSHIAGFDDIIEVRAKVDTGAKRTSIDTKLASKLSLGPVKDYAKVKTSSTKEARVRPIVPATLKIKGLEHNIDVSLEDRSHMTYDVILGRDIIENYKIDPSMEIKESISAEE